MTPGRDELTRPLGMEPVARRRRRISLPWAQLFVATVGALVLILAGWLAVVRDPQGGEPFAVAAIQKPPPRPAPPAAPAQPADSAPAPAQGQPGPAGGASAGALEQQNGVRVVRRGTPEAPDAIVIQIPSPGALAPAPDRRLVESSRHGPLPRIAADGSRPAEVYARPADPAVPGKTAGRIAIVIGGLGISPSATADAISKLPGPVTLAFSPYGGELERQAARARDGGHEILLQVPMEPFDYPDSDPGPRTLTTSAPASETLDKLAWVMSRMVGYVGVMNAMGSKFTASETSLAPVLREVGGRGLLYVDDGSSPRSLAPALAPTLRLPVARADAVIDAAPKAAAIDEQLARLEATAREKGTAVGTGGALPVTLDRVAAWARTLDQKGLQLVPVSAIVAAPPRP